MALRLDKVHHYVLEPGGTSVKLVDTNPYIRFSTENGTIFLQKGTFFYEGGDEVERLPTWLQKELEKANPKALKECGYEPGESQEEEEPSSVPNVDTPKKRPSRSTTGNTRRVVRRVAHGSSDS